MGTSIRIRGKDYAVERVERTTGTEIQRGVAYVLTGKRGAKYTTMRNEPRPEMMFLIYADKFGPAAVMDGVWLTDKGGQLAVVRS